MLQYKQLDKEVDEMSEDGGKWGGFDFFKGSSQIWRVINAARHGIEIYNNYRRYKEKFREKNLFVED
jgi:hypothetical protein